MGRNFTWNGFGKMGLVRSIVCRLRLWLSSPFSSSPPPPDSFALGEWGESVAGRFLRRQGFKILYRNFTSRSGGEIDLVCREKDTLVFVEVKTRTSEEFGTPAEAVTRSQQRKISQGALAWLRMLDNPELIFRFDIVEVVVKDHRADCRLIRNAFPLCQPYRY
jgi:putative endonuclease